MNRSFVIVTLAVLLISCKGTQETTTTTASSSTQSTATTAAAPATEAPATTTTMAATESSAPPASTPAPAAAGTSLASQDTNWPGVTAEVTEFRRKGNTLTAKVRLTNKGQKVEPEIVWKEVSLLDTTGGKKYEVLKDEKGGYIASNRQGWDDRWSAWLDNGESQIVWMKFPAPPATVKTISLQLPKMAPFDDLTIQD